MKNTKATKGKKAVKPIKSEVSRDLKKSNIVIRSISLPKDDADQLDRIALSKGLKSRSSAVSFLIREHI